MSDKVSFNIVSYSSDGEVIAIIDGMKYSYHGVGPGEVDYINKLAKKSPGNALNYLKKSATSFDKIEESEMSKAAYIIKNLNTLSEEYFERIKSTVPGKGNIEIFKNPSKSDYKALGSIIRFTAYNKTKTVYAWIYDQAHHNDVSRAVGIKHSYNDPDLLTGGAEWKNGKYIFSSSDFLKDFKRMISSESEYLGALLSNDWSWADKYILVTPIINKLKEYFEHK